MNVYDVETIFYFLDKWKQSRFKVTRLQHLVQIMHFNYSIAKFFKKSWFFIMEKIVFRSLYVLNNNGYLSIRATQNTFFPGRQCGTDGTNGLTFPNLKKISNAYGIKYSKAHTLKSLKRQIQKASCSKGPRVIEIICPENESIIPRAMTSKNKDGKLVSCSLSSMAPPLSSNISNKLEELGMNLG